MTCPGRIIHIKDGVMISLSPSAAYVDPTVARPRKPPQAQMKRVLARAEHVSVRPRVASPCPPRAYGPVKFLDMASDQCGWILPSGYRCGQKVHKPGALMCAYHDAIAHGRAKPVAEAAE